MTARLPPETEEAVRARLAYFRDLGVFDFYRRGEPSVVHAIDTVTEEAAPELSPQPEIAALPPAGDLETPSLPRVQAAPSSFNVVEEQPRPVPPGDRAAALEALRQEIGECMRCPLAQLGRHTIVFGDGDPNARLMFVGEGPGADEDAQGLPFVGRAGQLLNNMIAAMGLRRDQVYIANIVKCRPPQNRVPEPAEANTCSPYLFRQIDIIRPEVLVALGSTAATYLLGAKSPLAALRGRIHEVRDTKLIVTYHPAFLLRDPRQKKEAWADLQIAMRELGLQAPQR